jgi:hypothetical protein
MRTKITCGWLVGHDPRGHVLLRNAELVIEGNTILFVGETPMQQIVSSFPGLSTRMSIPAIVPRTA